MTNMFSFFVFLFIFIFILFLGGAGYLFYRVIKKSSPNKSAAFTQNEQTEMKEWVNEKKRTLTLWEENDFTAIGSRMKFKYTKGFSRRLKGTLLNKKNKPIVAFYRVERGMAENGYMFASTSSFDLYYELKNENYIIHYNGELLGTIQKGGSILNSQGKQIGLAKHPIKIQANVPFYTHRAGESTYDFQMNGRLLAKIVVAPNLQNTNTYTAFTMSNENLGSQFIQLMDRNFSEEEKKWLNAMAILEGAVHGHWMI